METTISLLALFAFGKTLQIPTMKKFMIFAIAAATQFTITPFVVAQDDEEEDVFELPVLSRFVERYWLSGH